MNYELIINNELEYGQEFEVFSTNSSKLCVFVGENQSISEALNNKEKFDECMKLSVGAAKSLMLFDKNNELLENNISTWNSFNNIFDNILDLASYISFVDGCDIKQYLMNNPCITNKNIVLNDYVRITEFDKLEELSKEYKDYPNIHVRLEGNNSYIRLDECEKIMDEIRSRADIIRSLNLSPVENVMAVYDMVRSREYAKESGNDLAESRDLKYILFGDSIVCVGYSNLMSTILAYLGIKCDLVGLDYKMDRNEVGHMINGLYIDDSKYNIKGYYYLDSTSDSKYDDNDNYLLSYRYFLRSRDEMEKLYNNKYLFSSVSYNREQTIKLLNNTFAYDGQKSSLMFLDLINNINHLYQNVNNTEENYIDLNKYDCFDNFKELFSLDEICNTVNDLFDRYNNSIDAETLLKIVDNVRIKEYEMDKIEYPYSLKYLYGIFLYSKFEFSKKHSDVKMEKLLELCNIKKESLCNAKEEFMYFVRNDSDIFSHFDKYMMPIVNNNSNKRILSKNTDN